jgi:tryptophan-rich sensory protein
MLVAGVEIYNSGERGARFWLLAFVVVATVTYPLYTKGYDLRFAVPANVSYLGLVLLAIVVYSGSHAKAAWCLIPTVLWVSTATLYCLAQVRAEGLTP